VRADRVRHNELPACGRSLKTQQRSSIEVDVRSRRTRNQDGRSHLNWPSAYRGEPRYP